MTKLANGRLMVVRSLVLGTVVLTLTVAVVFAVRASVVRGQSVEVEAALVAGIASWLTAMCGLVAFVILRGWNGDVIAAFAPLAIRLLLSMMVLAVLRATAPHLWRAGAGGMVVVNYLALLVAEILVFVRLAGAGASSGK